MIEGEREAHAAHAAHPEKRRQKKERDADSEQSLLPRKEKTISTMRMLA